MTWRRGLQLRRLSFGGIAAPGFEALVPTLREAAQSWLEEAALWFAVPKHRTSHSKKRLRARNKAPRDVEHWDVCIKCQKPKMKHRLCANVQLCAMRDEDWLLSLREKDSEKAAND